MRTLFAPALIAATVALSACSEPAQEAKAPAGAMEGFANQQAKEDAKAKDAGIEAARAREAGRAADARQKVQAAEGIDRFERAEKALDEENANTAR